MGLGRAPREAAKPTPYTSDPPTQPQQVHPKAAPARASTPPPAPAPATSASPSIVPPTMRASTPPPAQSRPPPAAPGAQRKSESPSPNAGPKGPPPARATSPSTTIPDVLHHISGEEENTNPWDIPTEQNLPRGGEKG